MDRATLKKMSYDRLHLARAFGRMLLAEKLIQISALQKGAEMEKREVETLLYNFESAHIKEDVYYRLVTALIQAASECEAKDDLQVRIFLQELQEYKSEYYSGQQGQAIVVSDELISRNHAKISQIKTQLTEIVSELAGENDGLTFAIRKDLSAYLRSLLVFLDETFVGISSEIPPAITEGAKAKADKLESISKKWKSRAETGTSIVKLLEALVSLVSRS